MGYPADPTAATPVCVRHPDRTTYLRCNRCQRYMCGDCARSAAVGHQCVDCVRAGEATVRQTRTQLGGKLHASDQPVVTWSLIAICILVFLAELASDQVIPKYGLWPFGVAEGQWYRMVTSAFLHSGTTHILFNMWALYVLGPSLEAALGRLRFGLLYGSSLLGGSVLVYLLSEPRSVTVGASGAIFGLFGAAFVIGRRLNLDVRWVVALIALNLVFTFAAPALGADPISWQGHVGGLLTGSVVAAVLAYAPRERRNAATTAVTVALLVLFAALVWWRTGVLLAM